MAERPHGYARYSLDRCRCYTCGWAQSQYRERRQKMIAAGTWKPWTDATPVTQHLQMLARQGIGYKQVARLIGVNPSSLYRLLWRERTTPAQKVRSRMAALVLSVTAETAHTAAIENSTSADVDATGTHRRIRALVAVGWTLADQAREAGFLVGNYANLLNKARVTGKTARTVRDLYDRISMIRPTGRYADRARRWAATEGWPPPLAWDDDKIDRPECGPETGLPDDSEADAGLILLAQQGFLAPAELPPLERQAYAALTRAAA